MNGEQRERARAMFFDFLSGTIPEDLRGALEAMLDISGSTVNTIIESAFDSGFHVGYSACLVDVHRGDLD